VRKYLSVLIQLSSITCFSQSILSPLNIGSLSIGAYSAHVDDPLSCIANPAALANVSRLSAGMYCERRFLLPELKQVTGIAAIPAGNAVIGTTISYGGYEEYNESQLTLSYGKKLGRVDIGIQFNYTSIHITGFGADGAISAAVGSLWHLTDHLDFGIHITNFGGSFLKNHDEKLNSAFSMGVGYEPSSELLIVMEIIKEEDKVVNVHVGMQYQVMDHFKAKAGISTNTSAPYLGLGWKWKNMGVFLISGYHPQLGITPGLEIIFFSTNREQENPSS
jgi:hypothetical protein